jgi:hypothetical protein
VPPEWRNQRKAIVDKHGVWEMATLPEIAMLRPDEQKIKTPALENCACGNFARPNERLCNACKDAVHANEGARHSQDNVVH